MNLVEKLVGAGIKARPLARPPRDNPFLLSIDRKIEGGEIVVNEGNAKVDCYVDPKLRQAVLHIEEKARKITRKVTRTYGSKKPAAHIVQAEMEASFPVLINGKVKYKCGKVEWTPIQERSLRNRRMLTIGWKATADVTAQVLVDTKLDLLMGKDETAHFIAALPESAKSVKQAHRLLKPEGKRLKVETLRQGEWFFIPVSDSLEKKLNEYVKENPGRVGVRRLENGSSHVAKQAVLYGPGAKKLSSRTIRRRTNYNSGEFAWYVCGYVIDGRVGHHEPLFLTRWHRVERNNEVTFREPESMIAERPRFRPSTRSWD